jgi:hypothetical protein
MPSLLQTYPHPLVGSALVSLNDYTKYFVKSINWFLNKNKNNHLVIIKRKKILGLALLRFMEWDSGFFGLPIGCAEYALVNEKITDKEKVETANKLMINIVNLARKLRVKILYAPSDSVNNFLISALHSTGFNFICGEMEGLIEAKDMPYVHMKKKLKGEYKFRCYNRKDYSQVMKIAKEITKDVNSKFNLTPYLPTKQKSNYYFENIKNCCLRLNADDIFVMDKKGSVCGFVCYRDEKILEESLGRKFSFLVMGGVSRLERKKKIGSHLFSYAHGQIFKKSEAIIWKIYLHNLPMVRFILRNGFIPSFRISYTFCRKL